MRIVIDGDMLVSLGLTQLIWLCMTISSSKTSYFKKYT